jgi:type IV pilus assembly protein PilC
MNYFYTAKSVDGKTVTGNSTAQNLRELAKSLRDEDLILIKAVSSEQKNKRGFGFSFSKRISAAEKILMTKNLSVMVATGLALVNSLDVLANQAKNKNLKNVLLAVKEKINKGESLSSAMSNYPHVFSDFFVSMVQVGEESGTLEEVLKILSLQMEKEHKIKSEIQGAMIYPAIILTLMMAVGMIIALFVLPKLKEFFSTMSAPIPFYTRMLIDFGQFSVTHWPLLIAVPAGLVISILIALKTKTGKRLEDTLFLKIPVISG